MLGNACAVPLVRCRDGQKQVSILELVPCNGGPASGEWRGPACSESSLRTLDHNDSRPELLRWQRITETGSLETVASRMKKSV